MTLTRLVRTGRYWYAADADGRAQRYWPTHEDRRTNIEAWLDQFGLVVDWADGSTLDGVTDYPLVSRDDFVGVPV